MREIVFPQRQTIRQSYRSVDGDQYRKEDDEQIIYKVELDIGQLDGMAKTAAGNKSQQCNDGALRVTVLSRRKL